MKRPGAIRIIDLTRQAAAGAIYGGYLMNWFNGHTNQFKCLVNHAGAVEQRIAVRHQRRRAFDRELRMGVPVWDSAKGSGTIRAPSGTRRTGRHRCCSRNGELDFRVPMNESMTTYKILMRRKVPTKLVLFPEEGHWILRGENSKLHMQEVLGWLQKWL